MSTPPEPTRAGRTWRLWLEELEARCVLGVTGAVALPDPVPLRPTVPAQAAPGAIQAVREVTVTVRAGSPFTAVVGTFQLTAPVTDLNSWIVWGDGSASSGQNRIGADGSVEVLGTHTYAAPGTYTYTVRLSAAGQPAVAVSGTAVVQPSRPTVSSGNPIRSANPPAGSNTPPAGGSSPVDTWPTGPRADETGQLRWTKPADAASAAAVRSTVSEIASREPAVAAGPHPNESQPVRPAGADVSAGTQAGSHIRATVIDGNSDRPDYLPETPALPAARPTVPVYLMALDSAANPARFIKGSPTPALLLADDRARPSPPLPLADAAGEFVPILLGTAGPATPLRPATPARPDVPEPAADPPPDPVEPPGADRRRSPAWLGSLTGWLAVLAGWRVLSAPSAGRTRFAPPVTFSGGSRD
jgi:hypothetical protein